MRDRALQLEPFRDSEIYQSPLTKDLSSVALAWLTLSAFLWDWHLDYLADTTQLIISELATNALKFGSGTGLTSIYLRDDGPDYGNLVIEVTDDSQEMPVLSPASPIDECHRGLLLVDQLAGKWGVEPLGYQKIVWAHLEYDDKTTQAIDSHGPSTVRIGPPRAGRLALLAPEIQRPTGSGATLSANGPHSLQTLRGTRRFRLRQSSDTPLPPSGYIAA
jgi:hypothetical protein